MRNLKYSIYITLPMAILFCIASFKLNNSDKIDPIYSNICLGIFSSCLLTFINSIIGYRVERRRLFQRFSSYTKSILRYLNKYQLEWSLDKKIDFFLTYHDLDIIEWNQTYSDFSFILDIGNRKKNYIYDNIYFPIIVLNRIVNASIWPMRWHKDGSAISVPQMESIISNIENECIVDKTGKVANKLVSDVSYQLNDRYYKLMYGKKRYKKSKDMEYPEIWEKRARKNNG